MWRLILIFLVALGGFWFGKTPSNIKNPEKVAHSDKEFPVTEHKSFVIVIYAHNQALWCERALRSVFEQDYDHYRVIVVDDGSIDNTTEKAKEFIVNNNQDEKVILIRNEDRYGEVASLYRAIDSCLDREIVVPLDAKDWLASPQVLKRLNIAYQNPDVWVSLAQSIEYPSYAIREEAQVSYYAVLFKHLRLADLFANGRFRESRAAYLAPIMDLSGGRVRKVKEPVSFLNLASPIRNEDPSLEVSKYSPLSSFPSPRTPKHADIVLFSSDKPLKVYASLESIQRYMTGFEQVTVLYSATTESYTIGYEKVKDAFPFARFVCIRGDDFKKKLEKTAFQSPSEYIFFGSDDVVVKDFVDLKICMEEMEKTGAYGFYFRFGRHISDCAPSQPLSRGIYAWDIEASDWGAAPFDMTLFKKADIKKAMGKAKGLDWEKPDHALGLYFERSKMVNISNFLSPDELLAKFNQGLKIDIDPLYKVENSTPELDYIPQLIKREGFELR